MFLQEQLKRHHHHLNTDLFDDVENLKIELTTLSTSNLQTTREHGTDINDISSLKADILDFSNTRMKNIEDDATDRSINRIKVIGDAVTELSNNRIRKIEGDVTDVSNNRIKKIEDDVTDLSNNRIKITTQQI